MKRFKAQGTRPKGKEKKDPDLILYPMPYAVRLVP